ncbi:MAG: hypothetical protein K5917_06360 [Clostridiales bacterium]|nr:hypothetical protein [Clostridiales bacterium]
MFVSGLCFGKSKKKDSKAKSDAPLWLTDTGRYSVFPDSNFVSSFANGSSADEAKEKALAEISHGIKTSVLAETKRRYSMGQEGDSTSERFSIDENQKIHSKNILYMSEWTTPYYDSSMGMYACVAYINRRKAFEYVRPTLDKAKELFPDAYQKALSQDDDFKKIVGIKRSQNLLKDFYSVYDFARFIQPSAAEDYYDIDLLYGKTFVRLSELKSKVVVRVLTRGDANVEAKECLKKVLSDAGFGVSDLDSNYTALLETSMEIAKKEKVFLAYPSISVEVRKTNDGQLVGSYSSKLEKCAGFDMNGSKQKAEFEIKKDLEDNFINKL